VLKGEKSWKYEGKPTPSNPYSPPSHKKSFLQKIKEQTELKKRVRVLQNQNSTGGQLLSKARGFPGCSAFQKSGEGGALESDPLWLSTRRYKYREKGENQVPLSVVRRSGKTNSQRKKEGMLSRIPRTLGTSVAASSTKSRKQKAWVRQREEKRKKPVVSKRWEGLPIEQDQQKRPSIPNIYGEKAHSTVRRKTSSMEEEKGTGVRRLLRTSLGQQVKLR